MTVEHFQRGQGPRPMDWDHWQNKVGQRRKPIRYAHLSLCLLSYTLIPTTWCGLHSATKWTHPVSDRTFWNVSSIQLFLSSILSQQWDTWLIQRLLTWAPTQRLWPFFRLNIRHSNWINKGNRVSSCCHTKRYIKLQGKPGSCFQAGKRESMWDEPFF